MYEPRLYRNRMNRERFQEFRVVAGESDLWIGVSPRTYRPEMEASVLSFVTGLRDELIAYIGSFPQFRDSFEPLEILKDDPEIIVRMKHAGLSSGTGPMASVAGLVAGEAGRFLKSTFNPEEIVVENGGDIYVDLKEPVMLSIEAGKNRMFAGIGIRLVPWLTPAGVCTSSGMFGHSVSLGKADSVTVVCPSACLADAWATSVANRIQTAEDVAVTVQQAFSAEMISLVCIKDDRIGIRGELSIGRI